MFPAGMENSDVLLWETILDQHNLGMERGENLGRGLIVYGQQYFDLAADGAFTYRKESTHARQKFNNKTIAERLLALVSTGRSIYSAAKALGVDVNNARRTLKRYRAEFTEGPGLPTNREEL